MATCYPITPSQPDDPFYPVAKLETVPTFNRASYKATYNEEAPDYNASNRTKNWFDSSAPSHADAFGQVTYSTIIRLSDGSWGQAAMTMSAAEAASVNLYGAHSYSAYVVAPTTATLYGAPMNPMNLSLQVDAIKLAALFGLGPETVTQSPLPVVYPDPSAEPRRLWLVRWKSYQLTAGTMIFEQNENGVGAPGHWNLEGGEPNWISTLPSSLPPQNPVWPTPCRPMMANEKLATTMAGTGVVVYRADKQSQFTQDPTGSGGGLTPTQAAQLSHCELMLTKLCTFFNVNA